MTSTERVVLVAILLWFLAQVCLLRYDLNRLESGIERIETEFRQDNQRSERRCIHE